MSLAAHKTHRKKILLSDEIESGCGKLSLHPPSRGRSPAAGLSEAGGRGVSKGKLVAGNKATPLPNPPPQGGRGQAEQAASANCHSAVTSKVDPELLLAWYDRHARVLPWRARPGEKLDPYRVWLSEIMLQQTTVKTVAPYYARFLARWPTVADLAIASLDDVLRAWAGLGYYARARNLHACARAVVERHGRVFPSDLDALRALPGIGDYTAAAIGAIAFDLDAVPVDGNVERVISRLFAVEEELPAAKNTIKHLASSLLPPRRSGDFAQALMDLGAGLCSPKRPACALCPWAGPCMARGRGEQETFPRKPSKREGRLRRGAAFVVARIDGSVLLRRRPNKGLLGGMTEVPGSAWTHDFDPDGAVAAAPPLGMKVNWRRISGSVRHVFTHFPLELTVFAASVPLSARAPEGARWVRFDHVAGEALPTLMRKVLNHAIGTGPSHSNEE